PPRPPAKTPSAPRVRFLAGGDPAGPADPRAERLRRQRASVLDFLQQELAAVRTPVGRDDRARIYPHLEWVRAPERRLQPAAAGAGPACAAPAAGARLDLQAPENLPA